MKRLVVFLILGASLTACSSGPEKRPDCQIPAPMAEVGHAVSVPQMPEAAIETQTTATYDLEGLLQLDRVHKAGAANYTIANENALAIESRNSEVNALIECSRHMGVWIDVHAEDLNDEKRAHFIDNLWHRGVIVLGILVAVGL